VIDEAEEETGRFLDNDTIECRGVEKSLEFIQELYQTDPFDGILAFSQGSLFAAYLCTREHLKFPRLKFAIFFSGFQRCDFVTPRGDFPTIHIYGEKDVLIPNSASEKLSSNFSNPVLVVHDSGHVVPSKAIYKNQIKEFLTKNK